MRRHLLAIAVLSAGASLAVAPARAPAQTGRGETVVVLLKSATASGSIGPYEEAARGFRGALAPAREVVIFPEIPADYTADSVRVEEPDVVVALGAEAARFAAEQLADLPRVVALAPGAEPRNDVPFALLTSEVPAAVQVRWIAGTLPDVSDVGVIYDPRATQRTLDELAAAAREISRGRDRPFRVVPIAVERESEVPAAFRAARESIQALLFVPDPTVITRGTIGYLLKETLAAQIPAIGFNWYFVDNGAVLAFGIDYPALGRQTAGVARRLARTREPAVVHPADVTVWVNYRVAQKLRIRTDYDPDKVREIR